jgi:hypothetical protein
MGEIDENEPTITIIITFPKLIIWGNSITKTLLQMTWAKGTNLQMNLKSKFSALFVFMIELCF